MSVRTELNYLDPLYGDVSFSGPLALLAQTPAVQRLRGVRLSNIDSVSLPGISNISRYEHVLGTAYLAGQLSLVGKLPVQNVLLLKAAALLHDTAITPFGHLVEEAHSYVSNSYDHEKKWAILSGGTAGLELGGVNLQLFAGRESGIGRWADKTFGSCASTNLQIIFDSLNGRGFFGRVIAGDIDLDNLDNVTRISFHMGIETDRLLPIKVAQRIVGLHDEGYPLFADDSFNLIQAWSDARSNVYQRLMLSRDDFVGKAMLICATVKAFERGYLDPMEYAWTLTDCSFLHALQISKDPEVVETINSWFVGDLWPLSDLMWFSGDLPTYKAIYDFSNVLSHLLGRHCFVYRIKDKRHRKLTIRTASGAVRELGQKADRWLLGCVSQKRDSFRARDNRVIEKEATQFFGCQFMGAALDMPEGDMPKGPRQLF